MNKIDLLRKVEIKLMELYDLRKLIVDYETYVFKNPEKNLLAEEKELKSKHSKARNEKMKDLQSKKEAEEKKIKQAKLTKKVYVNTGKRPPERSVKPKKKTANKIKVV